MAADPPEPPPPKDIDIFDIRGGGGGHDLSAAIELLIFFFLFVKKKPLAFSWVSVFSVIVTITSGRRTMCGRRPTTASIVFILIGRCWRWRYRPTATSTATLFISTTSIWCAAWWIHFNFYCLELLALSSIWRRKKIFVNNKCEVMFWHNVIWLVSLRASFHSLRPKTSAFFPFILYYFFLLKAHCVSSWVFFRFIRLSCVHNFRTFSHRFYTFTIVSTVTASVHL